MKTITQLLDSIAEVHEVIMEGKERKIISSFFANFHIDKENKKPEEMKEILDWFLDGGTFTTHWRESVPHGERKNSKKRIKTFYFNVKKKCFNFQLGHTTQKNYDPCFWERGAEALVSSALCKSGEFSYYNNSFVDYVREKGAIFQELGEKE